MVLLLIFILGLFVGSFLNVLADRLPKEESAIKGRSHCEKCKKELAWFDLIPLLSFIFLKGKCRYCRTSLSFYFDASPDSQLQDDEALITSGFDKGIPRGLVIGEARELRQTPDRVEQRALVIPLSDLLRLEEVFIITNIK